MYQVDEYIILENNGVGKIIAKEGDIYQVQEYLTGKIQTAISEDIVRRICTHDQIEEVIDRIEFTRTIQAPNTSLRKEFYADAMKAYDELEWVKVIKTYYIQRKIKKAQPFEKKYAILAKEYLYSEISILLELPFDKVEDYINMYIQNN